MVKIVDIQFYVKSFPLDIENPFISHTIVIN